MTVWHSWWVFFLTPLIFFVAGYSYWRRKDNVGSLRFSATNAIRSVHRGLRAYFSEAPTLLKVLALILVLAALARPQEPNTKIQRNVEGIDIVITLDISDSMAIEDMLPVNRMESSKKIIEDFVKKRVSDRIGFVVFSGEAYTRVPMTLDYPLLINNIRETQPSRNIKMGTAIGVALANAVARIKDSTAKSKIIIFLTDGENNSGTIDPETALDIAKGYGIKIYSIGMGKDGDSKLPVYITDPAGNKIKQYRPIHSSVNDALLQKFADETGGKYWRATSGDALDKAMQAIDQLEKTKIATDKFTKYAELFQPYLRWAIIFYILSMILSRSLLRRNP